MARRRTGALCPLITFRNRRFGTAQLRNAALPFA